MSICALLAGVIIWSIEWMKNNGIGHCSDCTVSRFFRLFDKSINVLYMLRRTWKTIEKSHVEKHIIFISIMLCMDCWYLRSLSRWFTWLLLEETSEMGKVLLALLVYTRWGFQYEASPMVQIFYGSWDVMMAYVMSYRWWAV